MDFAEAFEAPVIERIGGRDVTFPVLWNEDYLPWIAQIATERRAKSKPLIPAKGDPIDRFKMDRIVALEEVTVDAISERVWTIPGAMKVLDLSLAKAGVKDEAERKRIVNAVPPRRVCVLASEVSGLFERRVTAAAAPQPTEGDDPNARSAESPAPSESSAAPAATGS